MHDVEQDFAAWEEACRSANFFPAGVTAHVARAPGRLDVMGGIADYSGSLVAEMPIAQATVAGVVLGDTENGAVVVRSANAAAEGLAETVVFPQEVFTNPVSLLKFVREAPENERWAGYAAGCLAILRAEALAPRGMGAQILVRSEVPLGGGVSSSAALEVATMRALCAAFNISLDGLTLARFCQQVENDVMDAPCGIMDQVTSSLGEAGKLLLLLCQPYNLRGTVVLPEGWSVLGLDSGVKHSVGGTAYTRVRVAAFMGYKILTDRTKKGFRGYLANVSPEEYQSWTQNDPLPETLRGADFLQVHGGIYDTVTRVEPEESYPVRAATAHPIHEMARVQRFVECLHDGSDAAMEEAGSLMYGSHESYSACGLGAAETDLLVTLAREQDGVAGAKITGGGSGGTVCILCRSEREEAVIEAVTTAYAAQTGITPRVIRGTSPGAMVTEPRILLI
ncbi:MAG: galactokinase [Armatimonadaceae bacterium]